MKKKETVGKIASDLLQKDPVSTDPIEQMEEVLTEYEQNIIKTAQTDAAQYNTIFYVVVLFKTEPLMPNVVRNYYFSRSSCPTPDYDQAVYKVNAKDRTIDFLWIIPDKRTCQYLTENVLLVPPSQATLCKFVLSFNDGSLLQRCKQLNGETEHTGQLLLHSAN